VNAPVPPARERVPSSDGVLVALHHLAAGPPELPLLVAHATGFHGRCYQPLARALAGRFDVWALDFRGHGASAAPDGESAEWARFGDEADAAARWLAERSGRPISGFGHSMGGAALLMAALAEPERVAGLALYEPIVFPPDRATDGPSPLEVGARRRRPTFPSRAEAYRNFASKPPMRSFAPAALHAYVDGGLEPVDPAAPDGEVRLCCRPHYEAAVFAAASQHRLWDRLPEVAVPVTVVAGAPTEDDPPAMIAPQVVARIRGARYQPHPELDHFGPFVEPALVAEVVAAALPPSE
jgi:pimeloyl-ACP methyl ester carboxylesterase